MTNEYELADRTRASLIYTKEELLAGLTEGMVDSPHAIYPGADESHYYRGLITEAAPGTERQTAASRGEKRADEVTRDEVAVAGEPDTTAHPGGATR